MELLQSNDEMSRVADEWIRLFCPPNLVKDGPAGEKNGQLIIAECLRRYGILTISGLTETVHVLGAAGRLDLIPAPLVAPELTPEQKRELEAQKAIERQRQDYVDSLKPQPDFQAKVDAANRAKEKADAAESADATVRQIEAVINSYQCYKLSAVDFSGTDTVKKALRALPIYINRTQYPAAALKRIRNIISTIPDHPVLGSVEAANERLMQQEQNAGRSIKSASDLYRWDEPIR
jgi:hypothetical protein